MSAQESFGLTPETLVRPEIIKEMGGLCMIEAIQAAEVHLLGEVQTQDIDAFYEYPLRVYRERLASHEDEQFNLNVIYLLSILAKSSIEAEHLQRPLSLWSQDDYSGYTEYGSVISPIPKVAISGDHAVDTLPGDYQLPLLLVSYDERSAEGHVWFAPTSQVFEEGKQNHLKESVPQADNIFGTTLYST